MHGSADLSQCDTSDIQVTVDLYKTFQMALNFINCSSNTILNSKERVNASMHSKYSFSVLLLEVLEGERGVNRHISDF